MTGDTIVLTNQRLELARRLYHTDDVSTTSDLEYKQWNPS